MATRSQAREAVAGLLYAYQSGNQNIEKFAKEMLDEKKIRNKQQEFAMGLYEGVIKNIETIDEKIISNLKGWEFEKLGDMEKALLRLATYEILYTSVDRAVVINEAVELSKRFCTEQSPKFINGVLDAVE
ncbi:MAG: transcription antitermination factor NusB [Campylobacterales bacterium]